MHECSHVRRHTQAMGIWQLSSVTLPSHSAVQLSRHTVMQCRCARDEPMSSSDDALQIRGALLREYRRRRW
jgi:hypothetical protein